LYQDAIAIVRRFGKPDLFITFTCNPAWLEITVELLPGQHASDRPDLVSRVFHLKLKSLLDDILKKEIFGEILGYVSVIEFQKRGLPHCHMLFILGPENKIRTDEDIDRVVCAELPDPHSEPELHATVSKCMIHGP